MELILVTYVALFLLYRNLCGLACTKYFFNLLHLVMFLYIFGTSFFFLVTSHSEVLFFSLHTSTIEARHAETLGFTLTMWDTFYFQVNARIPEMIKDLF